MTTKTLLLTSWMAPERVISWQRAVVLVHLGKAEVLEEYDERIVSPSLVMSTPSVLRLTRSTPTARKRKVAFSRQNVFTRDRFCCQYCGQRRAVDALNYDHVVPRARGGKTSWSNIVTSCYPCNGKKGNRTPAEAGMPLRRAPFEPRSLPHLTSSSGAGIPASWTQYGVSRAS